MFKVAALIFDMDGVLVDSEPLHWEADRQALAEMGVVLPLKRFQEFIGQSSSMVFHSIAHEYRLSPEALADFILKREQLLSEIAKRRGVRPIDGVTEIIAYASTHYPCAVASSSSHGFIDTVMRTLGLEEVLNVRVSAHDLPPGRGKPHPDIYLLAAEKLLVNPRHCLAIEDARHGVTAAKAAGMSCIGLRSPHSGTQDLSHADIIVDNMIDVLTLLAQQH